MINVRKQEKITEEFGEIGLRRWGGIVSEEFLRDLQGSRALKIYREMVENDPTIGAIIFAMKQFMAQARVYLDPADDSREALAIAEAIEKDMNDMDPPFKPDFVYLAANFIVFGFAIFEKVFGVEDGRIRVKKLGYRLPESISRWELSERGEVLGCYQTLLSGQEVFLPRWKLLHIVTPSASYSPVGRSLLRNAYMPYTFKKHLQILEGIGIERDLVGLPVLYVPSSVYQKEEEKEKLRELLRSLRRDEEDGLILPKDLATGTPLFELQLLSLSGSRQFSTSEIIERYNREIAHTLLADLILVGMEARGSFALAREKRALFEVGIQTCLDTISSALQRDLIKPLLEYNAWDIKLAPKLRLVLPKAFNVGELVDLLSVVAKVEISDELKESLERATRELLGMEGG